MSISTAATRKEPAKLRVRTAKSASARVVGGQPLTGQALLDDMEAYRKKVAATPESALDFLIRLGVMTPGGRVKTLIRG